jgi:hypothetical protein
MLIPVLIVLMGSCKKDETSSTYSGPQRLKKISYYSPMYPSPGISEKTYTYVENKISEIKWTCSNPTESTPNQKLVFNYLPDFISVTYYNDDNGTWDPTFKAEYVLNGDKLIENRGYDPADTGWVLSYKFQYQYEENKLVYNTEYTNSFGHIIQWSWQDYTYDGNLLKAMTLYSRRFSIDSVTLSKKTCLTYSGDKLIETHDSIIHSGTWLYNGSSLYQYSGENLVNIHGNTFSYYSTGVLYQCNLYTTNTTSTYKYEKEAGNLAFYLKISDIDQYLLNEPENCKVP